MRYFDQKFIDFLARAISKANKYLWSDLSTFCSLFTMALKVEQPKPTDSSFPRFDCLTELWSQSRHFGLSLFHWISFYPSGCLCWAEIASRRINYCSLHHEVHWRQMLTTLWSYLLVQAVVGWLLQGTSFLNLNGLISNWFVCYQSNSMMQWRGPVSGSFECVSQ